MTDSLRTKLELLRHLKEGNIQIVEILLEQLATKARTNQPLYEKFHHFVHEHKEQIIATEQEERQENEQKVVLVDGSDDDDWNTDDEVEYDEQVSEDDEPQQRTPFKEIPAQQSNKAPVRAISKAKLPSSKSKCDRNASKSKVVPAPAFTKQGRASAFQTSGKLVMGLRR